MGTEKPILFSGALDELGIFLGDGMYQFTPEYCWPANHTWCFCVDESGRNCVRQTPSELWNLITAEHPCLREAKS